MLQTKRANNIFILLIIIFTVVISNASCYYDKEEILYPQSVCDTAHVTFSSSVVPILSSNCYSCHSGSSPSAGIKLDNYTSVKVQVDNGKLWGAVSHLPGYSPMPKNGTKMNTCNLAKIKKWIDAGALNN